MFRVIITFKSDCSTDDISFLAQCVHITEDIKKMFSISNILEITYKLEGNA